MAVRFHRAKLGVAAAFLPVLNYVLLKFSRHIAHQLVSSGYEVCFVHSASKRISTNVLYISDKDQRAASG